MSLSSDGWTVVATRSQALDTDWWDYDGIDERALRAGRRDGRILTAQRREPDGQVVLLARLVARPPRRSGPEEFAEAGRGMFEV